MSYQGNNPEGYPDPTANQAVGIVSREEKEAAKAKKRATREYDIRVYPPDHGGTIRNQMAHGNE